MSQHHWGECHHRVPGRGLLRCLQHPPGLSSPHRSLLRSEVGEMNDAKTCLTFDNFMNVLYLQMSSATLAPVHNASDHPPRLPHCHLLLSSRHLPSPPGIVSVTWSLVTDNVSPGPVPLLPALVLGAHLPGAGRHECLAHCAGCLLGPGGKGKLHK